MLKSTVRDHSDRGLRPGQNRRFWDARPVAGPPVPDDAIQWGVTKYLPAAWDHSVVSQFENGLG